MVNNGLHIMDSNGEYRVIVMVNTGCTWNALENHLFSCSMLLVQQEKFLVLLFKLECGRISTAWTVLRIFGRNSTFTKL